MTPYLDTWCMTCRTWHSSVWVHLGNRMVKVDDIDAALLEDDNTAVMAMQYDAKAWSGDQG